MLSQVTKVFSTCRQTKTIFLLFFLISTWTAKNGKRRFKDKNAERSHGQKGQKDLIKTKTKHFPGKYCGVIKFVLAFQRKST